MPIPKIDIYQIRNAEETKKDPFNLKQQVQSRIANNINPPSFDIKLNLSKTASEYNELNNINSYIKYIENANKDGWNNSLKLWGPPLKSGTDKNNRGFGVDIKTNPFIQDSINTINGKAYLSEQAERVGRHSMIEEALVNLNKNRLPFVKKKFPLFNGNISNIKKIATIGEIYRLGAPGFAKIWESPLIDSLVYGTNEGYVNILHEKAKSISDRINRSKEYLFE